MTDTEPLAAPSPNEDTLLHPALHGADPIAKPFDGLRVACLVNLYPAVSHTFVRREIHALERMGVHVVRFSLRGWSGELVDELDRDERTRTRYALKGGATGLLSSSLSSFARSPSRFLAALRSAARMSADSDRPWWAHLAYLAEACVLARWVVRERIDHLHAHFATNSTEIAMLVHQLTDVPYSFTAHGSDITNRPAQVGLPMTVGRAAFVVAVCSFGRSQIYKWIPHALWSKVHVVHCGLSAGYGADIAPPSADNRRLLCIGRLSREKGQLLLVSAARGLAEAGVDFELVLAGDGPMRGEIQRLVYGYGLERHVRITGWLDAAGIEEELRGARALVVPSLSEGLPVVIMEAMAAGRPVIAPYLAGIPELVKSGDAGWLYPAGDILTLQRAMEHCLGLSATELLRMSRDARKAVWLSHDVDTEVAKLAALFNGDTDVPDRPTRRVAPSLPQP